MATTASSLLAMILCVPHEDFSVRSLEQTPHVRMSMDGEEDTRPLDRLVLKLRDSLSKEWLWLWLWLLLLLLVVKLGMDHPSEDPPWDPQFDSLLHPGNMKGEPSSEIEKFGDFVDGTRLSDTWRSGAGRLGKGDVE